MLYNFNPVFDRTFTPRGQTQLTSVLPTFVCDEFNDPFGGPDERTLLAYARASVANLSPEPVPILPRDEYVAMSALQKAVRLGERQLALLAAATLLHVGGAAKCWRRIRTIAVEDIGAGDPAAAAYVLWLARQKDLHRDYSDVALAAVALDLLCCAVKSRDMCDMHNWAALPGSVDDLIGGFGREDADQLMTIAADPSETLRVRHAAARALYPAKFRGATTWTKRKPCERHRLYDAIKLPGAFAAMIEADVAFGGDVLTSSGPSIWAMMTASDVGAGPDPLDPEEFEVINGVLISAYDRHTRMGNRVLADLMDWCGPIRAFFDQHREAQVMECLKRALFYLEGGILRPRLQFDMGKDLYWSVLEAKFASTGLRSMEQGGWELLNLVQDILPDLEAARRRALLFPER